MMIMMACSTNMRTRFYTCTVYAYMLMLPVANAEILESFNESLKRFTFSKLRIKLLLIASQIIYILHT